MNLSDNHILIGLGGIVGKVLKAFRKRLFSEFDADFSTSEDVIILEE